MFLVLLLFFFFTDLVEGQIEEENEMEEMEELDEEEGDDFSDRSDLSELSEAESGMDDDMMDESSEMPSEASIKED